MTLSVTELQRRLYDLAQNECCDAQILELLWDERRFTHHEDAIWDFKSQLSIDPSSKAADPDFQVRCCDLVKDIVAFHNTYGGYIIVGVVDTDRSPVGFDRPVDVDALVQRIKADTGTDIHFTFRNVKFQQAEFGLFLVPRRLESMPLAFKKQAKVSQNKSPVYKARDIFLRDGARSAPAETVEHYSFLFGPRTRGYSQPTLVHRASILDNNLRARDPSLIEFIGRREDLAALWRWLGDQFNPVRLITGVGGVGKTTLVRNFCEQLLERSPLGFERLIWVTAKRIHWRPHLGKKENARTDELPQFDSPISLLSVLADELAVSAEEIAEATSDPEGAITALSELILEALTITPSFVVVDDLDTLASDDQVDVFQRIVSIVNQTISAKNGSRALITARLKLGASAPQLLSVQGFNKEEFKHYVGVISDKYQVQLGLDGKPKIFDKFFRLSGGSPLYAAEIVRLVGRGQGGLDQCLEQFKKSDGEEVRRFSFERELNALTDNQLLIVYSLSILEQASFIELQEVTGNSAKLLADDLQSLREYHLVSVPTVPTAAGQMYEVEGSIILLRELVASKIRAGQRRIESQCNKLRNAAGSRKVDAGLAISRIVALWEQNRHNDALEVAIHEAKERNNRHKDIQCVLGRAYLRVEPPQAAAAEVALRSAHGLGCTRHELFDLWIEAKRMRSDWRGVVDTAELAMRERGHPKYVVEQAAAYFALGEAERVGAAVTDAISNFQRCGRMLNDAIRRLDMSGLFEEANHLRRSAYIEAISLAKSEFRDPGSSIEVAQLCFEAFDAFVRTRSVIFDAVEAISVWATHVVEFRDRVDVASLSKMEDGLKQLQAIERVLHDKSWTDLAAVQRVQDCVVRMSRLVQNGRDQIGRRA